MVGDCAIGPRYHSRLRSRACETRTAKYLTFRHLPVPKCGPQGPRSARRRSMQLRMRRRIRRQCTPSARLPRQADTERVRDARSASPGLRGSENLTADCLRTGSRPNPSKHTLGSTKRRKSNRGSQTSFIRVWDPFTLANQELPLKVPTAEERRYNRRASLPTYGRTNLWQ